MKKNVIIILLLISSINLFSQKDSTKKSSKQIFALIGAYSPDLKSLNTVLKNNQYPQFKTNSVCYGLAFVSFQKHLLEQEEVFYSFQTQKNDSISSSIKSTRISQSFGYPYVIKPKFQAYSMFGINYSWTSVKISNEKSPTTTFNNYASLIGNQIEMKNEQLSFSFETHVNFIIKVFKDPNDKNKLIVGLNGGYLFPANYNKWNTNNRKLENGPNINAGPYAAFMVGATF